MSDVRASYVRRSDVRRSDVRIGVVGAGRIAQAAHLPALARADGATLVAICDASSTLAQRVASRYGVPAYSSLAEMLAREDVEAVLVAVPDRLHLPLSAEALRAGKHVLVEKPMAGTLEDAEELARLADGSGLVLQVGAMKRHDPGVEHAADAIRTCIGRVTSASIWYRVMSALRPPVEATHFPALVVDQEVRAAEAAHKADRERYLLTTHGAHVLDGLRYLLGPPTDVAARMARVGDDYTWHVLAGLPDGGLAHVEITAYVHAEYSEGADVYGERGHVRLRTHFPFTLLASDVEVYDEETGRSTRAVFGDSNAYERQLEAFARSVRGAVPAGPDAADGLAAVRLIQAVTESVSQGGARVTP